MKTLIDSWLFFEHAKKLSSRGDNGTLKNILNRFALSCIMQSKVENWKFSGKTFLLSFHVPMNKAFDR